MKLRDWIRFKLHQCHHICYVCKYRDRCWNELGIKRKHSKKCDGLFEDVITIAIVLLLGFFFIIYCVCQGYAM